MNRLYRHQQTLQKTAFDGKVPFRLMLFDLFPLIADCGLALQARFSPNASRAALSSKTRFSVELGAFGDQNRDSRPSEVFR